MNPAPDPVVTAAAPAGGPTPASARKTTPVAIVLLLFSAVAFLYFARPVVLPLVLACMAGMTLKPLIRWLSYCHLPKALSAAFVLCLLIAAIGLGFFELGRPALAWMDDTPHHMAELRLRVLKLLPRLERFSLAAAAVNDLGATKEEKKARQATAPTIEVSDNRGTNSILSWTGTLLMGLGETFALLYLLLASGDQFTQKLVNVMPTLRDKRRAFEINREVQQNISHYLVTVTLINLGLGIVVGGGLYVLGVDNAAMWGGAVALLNYLPYFGPIAAATLLAVVGLLSFDTLLRGLLPLGWFMLLHMLEANFITPILLGRRFTLNPVVIFVSLIFWTWIWGVPGALLSAPILVSIKVICDRIPTLASVSELLTR